MTFDSTGGTGSAKSTETQGDVAPVDFEDLVARCMGNVAFAERILAKFEQRFEDDLSQLRKELDQRDAQGFARVAHRLKGASANVSATRLHDLFSQLERYGRTEQLREVPARMEELCSEWCRFKSQIQLFASEGAMDGIAVASD